jgi:hypothetical protein
MTFFEVTSDTRDQRAFQGCIWPVRAAIKGAPLGRPRRVFRRDEVLGVGENSPKR